MFLVSAAFALTAACGDGASEKDCKALLDHLIELEAAAGGEGGLPPEASDKKAQKKSHEKVAKFVREDFMKSCLENLPSAQVACGLKAKTEKQLAACDDS